MRLTIRSLTQHDLDIASHITQRAYRTTVDYRARLSRYLQLQPDGWVLALLDGRPVGMVGTIHYGSFAYIGLLGVHPDARRRGVGAALIEHILTWLEARGCPTVLLDASEEGWPLYVRYGFVEEDQVIHWAREAAPLPTPLYPSTQIEIAPLRLADMAAVTAFDASYFGAGRAALFASLLLEYPERAFVAWKPGRTICGFLFAQDRTIGPWVAENEEVAEVLLRRALILPFGDNQVVFAPAANEEARHLLEQYAFHKQRALRHMRRGAPALFRQRAKIYGQASLGTG